MRKSYWFLAILVLTVVGFSVLGQTNAEAWWGSHEGNVKDNNNGQQGDILVHSGDVQGQYNDVGTWVDPSCIVSLKGEKGEQGEQGERGYRGAKGEKGDRGERGYRGYRGYKGDKGEQGIQGIQGEAGQDGSDANVTHRYTDGAENKIANYGYNDYYSENAFKNNLINEGYSQVYDFAVEGLDLVEVGYYGKTADPNSYDTDYVLREEYEKYSSQYQDVRINKNKTNIKENKQNIKVNSRNINRNSKRITNVDNKHTEWNEEQDINIKENKKDIKKNTKKIKKNVRNINRNKKNIRKNKKEIKRVDKKHTEWNEIQDTDIINNTEEIINVDNRHTEWNINQDERLDRNEQQLSNHEGRIDDLEGVQYNVCGEINFLQGRRHKVGAYTKFNINRTVISEVGVRITFDLDESYSVKELDKVNAKLEKLTAQLNNRNIETEKVQVSDNKYTIQIKDKGKALKVINKW